MSLLRRTTAWLNLAVSFGTHVLVRMPQRVVRRSPDMQRFLGDVVPEGYTPLAPADRTTVPAAMRCISCGLCSIACLQLRQAPASAWDEPWTFVAGPSRSIDRADLVAAGITGCAGSADSAAVCPTGVPIPELAALVQRMRVPTDSTATKDA
jgi:succinate dehydrogenase/fumarate reductase-like Fe-S protein